jgi:hypothetical protein
MQDAASQVAKLINRGGLLPPKRNGKAIHRKSVANWGKQNQRSFHWLFLPNMEHFREAKKLWRKGKHSAARQEVLHELLKRLNEMKRIWMET